MRFVTAALIVALSGLVTTAQSPARYIPYADAKPVVDALRSDLLPADLRGRSGAELQAAWPRWVSARDAEIRARLEQGDEDSIVNLLFFGETFTRQPRITERDMDTGLSGVQAVVEARIADLVSAVRATGNNERLAFVRSVAQRKKIDPDDPRKNGLQQYLRDQIARFIAEREAIANRAVAAATKALSDPAAAAPEIGTLFSQRGLSSDTTMFVDFGLESALDAIQSNRLLGAGSVRRVAIVGPGLDFIDKREGYDFYPPQTLQPFAVIDSLRRLGLAGRDLRLTTFDLSPRINGHLAMARSRAAGGADYLLQLPRDTSFEWNPLLVKYWEQLGDQIGRPAPPAAAPPGVAMRAVSVRADVVRSIAPEDLNIVLQRPASSTERYDLIVATNILVYYDVFEQSLAMTNVAAMLRPGGLLLTNSPVFELPSTPVRSVGFTDVRYEQRDAGRDRIFWYQRQ